MSISQENPILQHESPAHDIPFEQLSETPAYVDLEQPLYREPGYDVAAELNLGGEDEFLVLDVRHSAKEGQVKIPFKDGVLLPENIEFLIVDKTFNPGSNKPTGFKGLRSGETVKLGRAAHGRFEYSSYVSGNHAEITYDQGQLSLRDLGSTNGTDAKFIRKDR